MLSIFTTLTDPVERGDNWKDAIRCYREVADEVVVINGGQPLGLKMNDGVDRIIASPWPKEFDWPLIGHQFQRGYEESSGDWVIHMDCDFIFHQNDTGRIRQALKDYPSAPAVSFYKWQFILPDRYNLKSRLIIAVNKSAFGDRIKFDSGGDLCQPSLDGKELNLDEMPQAGVPFYNYEKMTKTLPQVKDDVERMARAWNRHFGDYKLGQNDQEAFDEWLMMMEGRFTKPHEFIPLASHPKYVQATIANLKPEQWGYNGFGRLEKNKYA
jgi:glycosyltransferase involved in cell wall biosynthesis